MQPGTDFVYKRFTSVTSVILIVLIGCATSPRYTRGGKAVRPSTHTKKQTHTYSKKPAGKKTLIGIASYYGPGFHGKKTANGERFNMYELTAAHKTLPFNTRVRVTNLNNKKSVIVRINDRGPYKKGRIIDLSKGAAKKIDLLQTGTAKVKVEILK